MSGDYAYEHSWSNERVRLAGLEAALDPGTFDILGRLGVGPGSRCLEVGAGAGSVAAWLARRVAPGGTVVATDVETGFVEAATTGIPGVEVLRHDVAADELPTGFDLVHSRWCIEWLPDKQAALRRMVAALRPGGVLLDEEPVFDTMFGAEPRALGAAVRALVRHLQASGPVECSYGRRVADDLTAVGLRDVVVEGRSAIVRGGSPPASHFLRLTLEKFAPQLVADHGVTDAEYAEAVAALDDPATTVVMPVNVAAWGYRR